MAQITDLKELLKHEILDLYSAEEQIIDALPKMVDKASNAQLKKALRDHLKVTEVQKARLEEIKGLMSEKEEKDSEKKGFFSKLFGGAGGEKCKGTEGLIKEGEKMMGEDMTREVMDAAIIGAAQKIEHYEISGYGTAVAYARELGLSNITGLLKQTLDEEYAADDSLTKLAVGNLNAEAESAAPASSKESSSGNKESKKTSSSKSELSKSNSVSKSTISKGASKNNASKGSASKGSSKNSKSPGNKSAVKPVTNAAGKSGKRLSTSKSKPGKSKSRGKR